MSLLTEIFLTQATSDLSTQSLLYAFLINLGGLIVILILQALIFTKWRGLKNQQTPISSIMGIIFGLTLRLLVGTINGYIRFDSEGLFEINYVNIYQTIPWVLILFFSISLFRDLIKVPKKRQYEVDRVIRTIKITIFLLLIIMLVTFLPLDDALAGAIAALALLMSTVSMSVLVYRIFKERKKNSSKLTQMRLHMIGLADLMVALSFLSTPVVIIMAIAGVYNDFESLLNTFLNAAFTVYAGLCFYWSFFIPNWLKSRYDLVSTDSLL